MSRKIYTKKGDKGSTAIIGLNKIPKCDYRIEAIGSLDELNAYIGLLFSTEPSKTTITFKNIEISEKLSQIQNDLFNIGGSLAYKECNSKLISNLDQSVLSLEKDMDLMSKFLDPLKNFILPAGNEKICHCHISRAVCRRVERNIVKLDRDDKIIIGPSILKYINRLSDYLFVLARFFAKRDKIEEVKWVSNN